jgi:hypothetical protein
MFAKMSIGAAAIAVLIAPASAQAAKSPRRAEYPQQWNANTVSGAYGAANQSRTKRPAQRGGVAQPAGALVRFVAAPDGRIVGADPDAAIRFELRRDPYLCRY